MKRKISIPLVIIFLPIFIYLIVFKTPFLLSDIRPENWKDTYTPLNNGVGFLKQAQIRHGMSTWKNQDTIVYGVEHKFANSLVSLIASPLNSSPLTYQYVSVPGNRASSYYQSTGSGTDFLIGENEMGIYQQNAGTVEYGRFTDDFFCKAVRHLIEFPFEMSSANILEYIGKESWNSEEYHLVFASWDDFKPNQNFDQFIIWINKHTGLVDRFDATGRDLAPFVKVKVIFEYETSNVPIVIPKLIKVYDVTIGEMFLMSIEILNIET